MQTKKANQTNSEKKQRSLQTTLWQHCFTYHVWKGRRRRQIKDEKKNRQIVNKNSEHSKQPRGSTVLLTTSGKERGGEKANILQEQKKKVNLDKR